jgi:hypothetical protein
VPTNAPAVELTTAVLPLLPVVNTVTAAHQPNTRSSNPCHHCTPTSHAECPHLWLAAAALDLIIHSLRLTGRDESAERKTYAGTTSPPPTSGTCGVR